MVSVAALADGKQPIPTDVTPVSSEAHSRLSTFGHPVNGNTHVVLALKDPLRFFTSKQAYVSWILRCQPI